MFWVNAVMYIEGGIIGGPGYAIQTTPPMVFLPYIPETALYKNRTSEKTLVEKFLNLQGVYKAKLSRVSSVSKCE